MTAQHERRLARLEKPAMQDPTHEDWVDVLLADGEEAVAEAAKDMAHRFSGPRSPAYLAWVASLK